MCSVSLCPIVCSLIRDRDLGRGRREGMDVQDHVHRVRRRFEGTQHRSRIRWPRHVLYDNSGASRHLELSSRSLTHPTEWCKNPGVCILWYAPVTEKVLTVSQNRQPVYCPPSASQAAPKTRRQLARDRICKRFPKGSRFAETAWKVQPLERRFKSVAR
jgi:hypothetical protein